MKHESLPADYGIAHLADGRLYPLRVRLGTYVDLSAMHWTSQRIPFACGPQPTRGTVSFADCKLAEQYCHREHEEFLLLWKAAKHGWQQELYPERNAWYREEILRLVLEHDPRPYRRSNGDYIEIGEHYDGMQACIYFILHGTFQAVRVQASTFDEVFEALYHEIYEQMKPHHNPIDICDSYLLDEK